MRILVYSDIHLEFAGFEPPDPVAIGVDVVILAGDTGRRHKGVVWAKEAFKGLPVICIAGNHEYYTRNFDKVLHEMRTEAEGSQVHVLENEAVIIDGVRFLGCTLWTDFALFGNPPVAAFEAQMRMNDYKKIRIGARYRRFNPNDSSAAHRRSRAWLEAELGVPPSYERESSHVEAAHEKTIVVTHHAPSARSVPEFFKDDLVSAAYASHLDELVEASGAAYWIHGHIHTPQTYEIGSTTVLSNPRGYPDERTGFDSQLVIEV